MLVVEVEIISLVVEKEIEIILEKSKINCEGKVFEEMKIVDESIKIMKELENMEKEKFLEIGNKEELNIFLGNEEKIVCVSDVMVEKLLEDKFMLEIEGMVVKNFK